MKSLLRLQIARERIHDTICGLHCRQCPDPAASERRCPVASLGEIIHEIGCEHETALARIVAISRGAPVDGVLSVTEREVFRTWSGGQPAGSRHPAVVAALAQAEQRGYERGLAEGRKLRVRRAKPKGIVIMDEDAIEQGAHRREGGERG